MRHPGEGGEFVHQALEVLDLADNGAGAFLEQFRASPSPSVAELAAQALG